MSNSPSSLGTGKSVQLHDNGLRVGSLLDQLPAYLTSEQVQNLAAKATEESVRLEGKARELNLEYRAGVRAIETHIDTVNALPRGDLRHSVHSDVNDCSIWRLESSGRCIAP